MIYFKIHPDKPIEKPHSTSVTLSLEKQKRPPWAQKDPLFPDGSIIIQNSESKPIPTEPIVHQVPHVIDRSTGQPLLVNIQPSQVANVVIPQGGTQALIFGDTNEPHISGQYFDDPSPYPEPEVGPDFVGIQKVCIILILKLLQVFNCCICLGRKFTSIFKREESSSLHGSSITIYQF